jgi:hypothetical protein
MKARASITSDESKDFNMLKNNKNVKTANATRSANICLFKRLFSARRIHLGV